MLFVLSISLENEGKKLENGEETNTGFKENKVKE